MLIFLPLIYLALGFIIGKSPFNLKGIASYLLNRFIIPLVIIYNIATHQPGVFIIIFASILMMVIMLFISKIFTSDPIKDLCFCYLNVGWLGLPIASTLFGSQAAMIFIAIYVGSSIFGNSIGASMLSPQQEINSKLLNTFQSPPIIAFIIGLITIPLNHFITIYFHTLYEIFKFLLSLLGMMILGMWLASTKIKIQDLITALQLFLLRATFIALFISACLIISYYYYPITLLLNNPLALYLLCLLPPAANIIVLETYYAKTGRSASMIACGTLVSLLAIGCYAIIVRYFMT